MNNVPLDIITHLKQDTKLKSLIDICPLYLEKKEENVFNHLLRSIISQQLAIGPAATIHGRFLNLVGQSCVLPESILNIPFEQLKSVGLSAQKTQYILNVANYFYQNSLYHFDWDQYSDQEIIQHLTKIKGVGDWTVQMILMFNLHRLDVFPMDDLVIRNGMIKLYQIQSEKKELIRELNEIADQWRPYRSIACRYIWASKNFF